MIPPSPGAHIRAQIKLILGASFALCFSCILGHPLRGDSWFWALMLIATLTIADEVFLAIDYAKAQQTKKEAE